MPSTAEPPVDTLQKEYVDNGILFFMTNKMNFMIHDDIIDICKSFYNENEIEEAKTLMYEKYDCVEQGKTHRGSNKATNDLKEMLSFLAQSAAPKCTFCITRCTQVPAVVMDFVDAAAMNRHITNLRGEMTVSSSAIKRIMARMEQLESALHEQKQNQQQIQQRHRRRQQQQQIQHQGLQSDSAASLPSNPWERRQEKRERELQPEHRPQRQQCDRQPELAHTRRRPSSVADEGRVCADPDSSDSGDGDTWRHQRHQRKKIRRHARQEDPERKGGQRRRDRSVVIGTRKNATLSAARQMRDVSLFISRLAADVDLEVLRAQVEEIAGVAGSTTCELQPQRHSNYKSCKVIVKGVPKENVKNFYEPLNWDEDILVRRWFD